MKGIAGRIVRAVVAAATVLVLPVLYLLWPVKKIRFGAVFEHRLGHLITDPILLCRNLVLTNQKNQTTDIFIAGQPANAQAMRMVKRLVTVWESNFLRRLSFGVLPVLQKTRFYVPLLKSHPAHELYSMDAPRPFFTSEEEKHGQEGLRKLGIGADDWFVCFHNRSPEYLGNDWDPVRDCIIEDYIPAAEWVVEQGGFAIRMGSPNETPLDTDNTRIIDYACRYRSDFMDMYLLSKCKMFLGCTSGPICVPVLMGVPSGMGNKMPYFLSGLGKYTLFTPKLLRRTATGELLSFAEIKELGMFNEKDFAMAKQWKSETYKDLGLQVVNNSPDELVALAMDLMDMVNNVSPSDDVQALQQLYHTLHTEGDAAPCAGRIGPRFIKKYEALINPAQNLENIRAT